MKTDGYVKRYKRLDKAQSQKQFDHLIELFESNKLIAIDEINEMKTIVTKKGILTKRGEALLDWIQSELIDRSFMVMTRLKYQDTLKLLPHSVVNKRLQRIDQFVDSVMKSLAPLKQEKLILESTKSLKKEFKLTNISLKINKTMVARKYGCDSLSVSQ